MPLPDASKKSPRVYTLLQNTDLDSVTFDTVQAVGNPIAIEEANEDEMRRLVLVNLCRLVTSGEWTGLLEAGGGGGGFSEMLPLAASTGADQYDISNTPPWNGSINSNFSISGFSKPHAFPFIAPTTGTVSAIGINVVTAEAGDSIYVGIYSQDDNFLPETLLGYATISLEATGVIYQTSISATIELTAGTQNWYFLSLLQSSGALLSSNDYQYLPAIGLSSALTTKKFCISDNAVGSMEAPPATFTPNKLENENRVLVGLKF